MLLIDFYFDNFNVSLVVVLIITLVLSLMTALLILSVARSF
mgnify:CR=1 FL=1